LSNRLSGKVALVTGAASGIGLETAKLFLEEGASLVVTDVSEEIDQVAKNFRSVGSNAVSVVGDVSKESDSERMVRSAVDAFGRLDILFNNAGYSFHSSAHELRIEDWERQIAVNLTGTFLVSKYAVRPMMEKKSGSIVNNASTHGLIGTKEDAPYSASKGGVISLTKQMAVDYAQYNIRVNCVCAGPTLTPRIQRAIDASPDPKARIDRSIDRVLFHRFAHPREIAYGVLFLASDEASFVTGSSLVIDGGQTIR
jgi:NAD(P)-dependent dehydrogenase (short-subunit alcohol dehydrogenase family)